MANTSTDWKALCAELVAGIDNYDFDLSSTQQDYSVLERARAALAQPEPVSEQADSTLRSIRENTPRYRMSVIVSTHDSAIDTRMSVIWSALEPSKEILESVSLPEQLPPLGNL